MRPSPDETEPLGPFNDASVRAEADDVCCGVDSEASARTKNVQSGCDDGFVSLKYQQGLKASSVSLGVPRV